MKATKLEITNVGAIGSATIDINKPLMIFFGEVCAGKSTILNAVRWCFGGKFPADIISHGAKEASITLTVDNGSICREWYRNKEGEATERPIKFIQNGKSQKNPVAEIKRLLNPNHLIDMNEVDRAKFLLEVLNVNTAEADKRILELEDEARDLRVEIKTFGDVVPVKVDAPADLAALQAERAKIVKTAEGERQAAMVANSESRQAVTTRNWDHAQVNSLRERRTADLKRISDEILSLQERINTLAQKKEDEETWLSQNPELPIEPVPADKPLPPPADTTEIDTKIANVGRQAAAYAEFLRESKRATDKESKEKTLADTTAAVRALREKKLASLKTAAENCPVKGLSFDDEGGVIYEKTTASMLSTSQMMVLSSKLSALYPDGLGLELIDRGESLGKSIYGLIDHATANTRTILATVVGDKPAKVPEDIGVFIVEAGKVTDKSEPKQDELFK